MQTKVCEPDVFYRSDTHKLTPFLVQYTLNFCNHPDAFASNSDKVTFGLSYLKGTTLNWFELSLTSGESPPWLNNYSDFIGELKNNFGPHDPEGKAKADLKNLNMHNNQHIMKYLVNFNCLTTLVQWGNATLWRHLYHGLPSCIKDEIAHIGVRYSISYSSIYMSSIYIYLFCYIQIYFISILASYIHFSIVIVTHLHVMVVLS